MPNNVRSGLALSWQQDPMNWTTLGKSDRMSMFFCISSGAEINVDVSIFYRIWSRLAQLGWEDEMQEMPYYHNKYTRGLTLFEELPCVRVSKPLTDRGEYDCLSVPLLPSTFGV